MEKKINDININIKIKLKNLIKDKTTKYTRNSFYGNIFLEFLGQEIKIGNIGTQKIKTKKELVSEIKEQIMWKLKERQMHINE